MLVLSRKIGERLVIGDGTVLVVLGVKGTQVRLGVEAPPEVPVWREECVRGTAVAGLPVPGYPQKPR